MGVLLLLLWAVSGPGLGDAAPPLELTTLTGTHLAHVHAGQPATVEFFATWCAPCRDNLEDLRALHAASPDFQLIVVAVEGDAPRVRAYFAKRPTLADVVVVFDPGARAAHRWGEDRLPTTFFLDRAGVIRHINRGHGEGFRARAEHWLTSMRDVPRPPSDAAPTPAPGTAKPGSPAAP
jgi:peroxiredoxin